MRTLRLLAAFMLFFTLLPGVVHSQTELINSHLVLAGHLNSGIDTGSVNAYAVQLGRTLTQYEVQACYSFRANSTNTGAATVNFSSVGGSPMGAKSIVKMTGGITTPLIANDIRSGQIVVVCYDGTNMQMMSQLGNAATGSGDFSSNTATSVDGEMLLFSGTTGKLGKRATGTGLATLTAGVQGTTAQPTGAVVGTTDAQDVSGKRVAPRVVQLSAATGTVTAPVATVAGGDVYYRYDISGALTIPAPTGTPVDGQRLLFVLKPATTAQTLTFNTGAGAYSAEGGLLLPTTTGDSATYVKYAFSYNSSSNRWAYDGGNKSTAPLALDAGGTGKALTDPGGHRLWGWDDTDNDIRFFTIGSGLSYDPATDTLTATGGGGANAVLNNQANTYTTGAQDMGAATSLVVPKATGAAPIADGDVRYDTTKDALVVGAGQGGTHTVSTLMCAASGTSTNNDDTGFGADFDHTITCSIPANFLQVNKILRVTVLGTSVLQNPPPQFQVKLKMSGVTIFSQGGATQPGNSVTRSGSMAFLIYTLSGPSATGSLFVTSIGSDSTYFGEINSRTNATAQPVTIDTDGPAITLTFTSQWGTNQTGTSSFTMRAMVVEALN